MRHRQRQPPGWRCAVWRADSAAGGQLAGAAVGVDGDEHEYRLGDLAPLAGERVAWLKVLGFLALQTSLAALILLSLWAVFRGSSQSYRSGESRGG